MKNYYNKCDKDEGRISMKRNTCDHTGCPDSRWGKTFNELRWGEKNRGDDENTRN